MTNLQKTYADLFRYNKKTGLKNLIFTAIRKRGFRHICYLRWYQSGYLHQLARILLRQSTYHLGLDIHSNTQIGAGFVLHHPYNIAVNGKAVLGENVTLYHGCTIGAEFRGMRAGNPTLGNNVWVGGNSVILPGVHIGDNSVIGAGSVVTKDIPACCVAAGNPCRVIRKITEADRETYYHRVSADPEALENMRRMWSESDDPILYPILE